MLTRRSRSDRCPDLLEPGQLVFDVDRDHGEEVDLQPSAQRLRMVRPHESGTTWTVTSLVEHGLLAFASSERYRPAEQDRVETVEHDRRRDQKLLDAQGEDEIRPHRGFEDEA